MFHNKQFKKNDNAITPKEANKFMEDMKIKGFI